MLPPLKVERYNIFPLLTAWYRSPRVQCGISAPDGKNSMTHRASGQTVAVVDDDPAILRSLECLLESADYRVRLFASGAELINSGCLAEVDCLVSDIEMPGMDGFALLRQVHASRPELPVLLITGYPETIKRLPADNQGGSRVFAKPFRGPELLTAISEALRSIQ